MGSPAPAGIDRTRGGSLDGPFRCHSGSPAPAGIDRLRHCLSMRLAFQGFPRTRGDRPGPDWFPRTPSSEQSRGSPAPAGIDPLCAIGARRVSGFPRTRGDRPYWWGFGQEQFPWRVPPHPRG